MQEPGDWRDGSRRRCMRDLVGQKDARRLEARKLEGIWKESNLTAYPLPLVLLVAGI